MRHWYCLYTKPGQEDNICRKLSELPGVELFNPKIKRKKYVRSRLKEVVEELFPSYVFSLLNPYAHYHTIKYTRGIRRFVGDSTGSPYVVDESLIQILQSEMKDGFVCLERPGMTAGEKVVILDGPFSGLTGLFLNELKPGERVMILLNTLQYQARVEVPKDLVAKA
jgi:transcription elongation factor/antiterminator RfaH